MNANMLIFFEKLREKPDILGILLFGSYARGDNRPDSDVDLIVIQKEGFIRTVEYQEEVAFEITYTTEKGAIKYWQENPDDCVDLWITAIVIFDRDGTINRLRLIAKEIEDKGKAGLDDNKRKHFAFDARDQINGVKTLASTDPSTANLLLSNKVFQLIELYFDIRKLWRPAPKQFLKVLRDIDVEFAKFIIEFYSSGTSLERKIVLAEKITGIVFEI